MNVIFTCGGTGGHINPAIAVANIWKERHPDSNILFIGAKGRMEEQLVPKAGYRLHTIPATGISREKSLRGLKHNIRSVSYVLQAVKNCKKVIREFRADVVIGAPIHVADHLQPGLSRDAQLQKLTEMLEKTVYDLKSYL